MIITASKSSLDPDFSPFNACHPLLHHFIITRIVDPFAFVQVDDSTCQYISQVNKRLVILCKYFMFSKSITLHKV